MVRESQIKSPAAITIGSDAVVEDAFGVMTGVIVPGGICVGAAVTGELGVNVFGCATVGIEVVVDVRVVAVDVVPLIVMTNWGAKPTAPCVDE